MQILILICYQHQKHHTKLNKIIFFRKYTAKQRDREQNLPKYWNTYQPDLSNQTKIL